MTPEENASARAEIARRLEAEQIDAPLPAELTASFPPDPAIAALTGDWPMNPRNVIPMMEGLAKELEAAKAVRDTIANEMKAVKKALHNAEFRCERLAHLIKSLNQFLHGPGELQDIPF